MALLRKVADYVRTGFELMKGKDTAQLRRKEFDDALLGCFGKRFVNDFNYAAGKNDYEKASHFFTIQQRHALHPRHDEAEQYSLMNNDPFPLDPNIIRCSWGEHITNAGPATSLENAIHHNPQQILDTANDISQAYENTGADLFSAFSRSLEDITSRAPTEGQFPRLNVDGQETTIGTCNLNPWCLVEYKALRDTTADFLERTYKNELHDDNGALDTSFLSTDPTTGGELDISRERLNRYADRLTGRALGKRKLREVERALEDRLDYVTQDLKNCLERDKSKEFLRNISHWRQEGHDLAHQYIDDFTARYMDGENARNLERNSTLLAVDTQHDPDRYQELTRGACREDAMVTDLHEFYDRLVYELETLEDFRKRHIEGPTNVYEQVQETIMDNSLDPEAGLETLQEIETDYIGTEAAQHMRTFMEGTKSKKRCERELKHRLQGEFRDLLEANDHANLEPDILGKRAQKLTSTDIDYMSNRVFSEYRAQGAEAGYTPEAAEHAKAFMGYAKLLSAVEQVEERGWRRFVPFV